MKYSVVVLDLDGTYLNSAKQVSERNLAAVRACFDEGMKIVIATARPPRAVKEFLPEELHRIAAFAYYNGAQVMCRHTGAEWHESIPAALTAEIIDFCLSRNPDAELTMEYRDEWFGLREHDYSVFMNVKANPVVKSLEELRQYEATKLLLSGEIELQPLYEAFAHRVNIIATDNNQLVQMMPLRASKEQAVAKLCEIYGAEADSVIVFGDDHNDIGLFRSFGYSVAMGNAIPELKEIADEITESNDRDGVAVLLEKMLA